MTYMNGMVRFAEDTPDLAGRDLLLPHIEPILHTSVNDLHSSSIFENESLTEIVN